MTKAMNPVETEIGFMKDYKAPTSNRQKTSKKFVLIAKALKRGATMQEICDKMKVSEQSIKIYIRELKDAAKSGFKSVQEYLKADRPCAEHKKMIKPIKKKP